MALKSTFQALQQQNLLYNFYQFMSPLEAQVLSTNMQLSKHQTKIAWTLLKQWIEST
jgi:hypothetical protein